MKLNFRLNDTMPLPQRLGSNDCHEAVIRMR
jgi:hypothetical protein